MSDFVQDSQQTLGGDNILSPVTIKFIQFTDASSGLGVDLCDDGDPNTPICDSSFGAIQEPDLITPEPSTLTLAALALVGLLVHHHRRRA